MDQMTIYITGRCNLGCSYCFQAAHDDWHKDQGDSSPETIKAAVDWLIGESRGDTIQVAFFGGEPTLRPDLLEYACEYATEAAAKVGKKAAFSITTNMTAFTDRIIALVQKYGIGALASIDGMPRPSNQRFYRGTTISSAQHAMDNLLKAKEAGIMPTIRWTLMPLTTADLSEDVEYFANLGFRNLAVEFVYESEWDAGDIQRLETELRKVARFYTSELRAGRDLYVKAIDDGITLYKLDRREPLRCGLGHSGVGVGTNGEIAPCHRYISRTDYKDWQFGDVTNFDRGARDAFVESWDMGAVEVSDGRKCQDCPVKLRCNGGVCLPVNLDTTGKLHVVPSWHCEIQLCVQRVANDVVGILYGEANPLMVAKLAGVGERVGGNVEAFGVAQTQTIQ